MRKKFFILAVISMMLLCFNVASADVISPSEILQQAKNNLDLSNKYNISDNITLPSKITVNGTDVAISWASSNENIFSADGVVNRTDKDTQVTLTATLQYNNYIDKKVFDLNVKAQSNANILSVNAIDAGNIEVTYDGVPSNYIGDYKVLVYGLDEDKTVAVKNVIVKDNKAILSVDLSGINGELIVNDLPADNLIKFKDIKPASTVDLTYTANNKFKPGSVADITINAQNKVNYNNTITLVVALYNNDNNNIIKYSSVTKTISTGKSMDYNCLMKIPASGNCYIKYFTVDNLKDMNQLNSYNPILIK